MSNAPRTREAAAHAISGTGDVSVSSELEAELVKAMAEIDRGEYIELTLEQVDHAAATGELPWPDDEFLASRFAARSGRSASSRARRDRAP